MSRSVGASIRESSRRPRGRQAWAAAALAVLAGCGSSGSPLAPSSSGYTGAWHLSYKIVRGPSTSSRCYGPLEGTTGNYILRVVQDGDRAEAVWISPPIPGQSPNLTGAVNLMGAVSSDGELNMSGALDEGTLQRDVRITAHHAVAGLSGTIERNSVFPPRPSYFEDPLSCATVEQILSGFRSPLTAPTTFSGRWLGTALKKNCTATGDYWCGIQSTLIEVVLTSAANSVSGTLNDIPVTGTANGASVTLEGQSVRTGSGTSLVRRVHLAATQDRLGRLTGICVIADEARTSYSIPTATRTVEYELVTMAAYE